MAEQATCQICGEPMPEGEEMFNYHGFSGPCPSSPLPIAPGRIEVLETALRKLRDAYVALSTKLSVVEDRYEIDLDEILEAEWIAATEAQLGADAALNNGMPDAERMK